MTVYLYFEFETFVLLLLGHVHFELKLYCLIVYAPLKHGECNEFCNFAFLLHVSREFFFVCVR